MYIFYEFIVFLNVAILGRISGLEEDLKNGKILLTKVEMEKRQLHERFTDLEKVKRVKLCICVRK